MKKAKIDEFKIEKGVPIPNANRGWTAVLRKLKIGDSVELPVSYNTAHSAAVNAFGESGHVTVRKTDKGCRIWRIK